ncbi:hypothetical protein JCM3774_006481 [Rhodotorula dairenensis]
MFNEAETGRQPQATEPTTESMPSPGSEDPRSESDAADTTDSRSSDLGTGELSPRTVPTSGLPPPVPIASTSSEYSIAHPPSALSQSSDPSFPSSNQLSNGADRSPRPAVTSRSLSFKADGAGTWSSFAGSVGGGAGSSQSRADAQRTARAASDGAVLNTGFGSAATAAFVPSSETGRSSGSARLSSLGSDGSSNNDEQAFFREHQRRSLESTASQHLSSVRSFASPPLASARLNSGGASSPFFQPPSFVSTGANTSNTSTAGTPNSSMPPLLSPTSTSPPTSSFAPSSASSSYLSTSATPMAGTGENGPPGSKGATLHLGDLDVWMDELYVRECCSMMGWDNVISIKMSRGASPSSGYCFLTFPTTVDAARVLTRFNTSPPVLMPRSNRTFKLNWGTGLPGVQPRWDGEFSVFVGDLAREVGESDLMTLFTPLFPSTKSAKVMCDPSTGLSRGYGFVRFAEESDMQRALLLGANSHSGLLLHGRTIRISEASGPNVSANGLPGMPGSDGHGGPYGSRDRPRSVSDEVVAAQQGYFPPYANEPVSPNDPNAPQFLDNPYAGSQPTSPYSAPPFASSFTPYASTTPGQNGGAYQSNGAPSESNPARRAPRENQNGGRNSIPAGAVPPGGDPNNTTVFVGGLPACISEETLKSFFHHFGDITYCKIPPGKGCGFVQFVRRQDAELAIAKMNDFPIHGKSRIRLSWGRSQGDKQVEHVRKLASALGVPFDAVWRMVQGQDNSTIKQIATAVGTNGSNGNSGENGSREGGAQNSAASTQAASARMDLRAVANAAGLSESEVLELVKNGANAPSTAASNGPASHAAHASQQAGPEHPTRAGSESMGGNSSSHQPRNGGPYSRVSPSSFGNSYTGPHGMMPLSPPPTGASAGNSFAQHQVSHPPFAPYPGSGPSPSPYTAIRPESYLVQPPATSPYERVDFVDGGRPSPNGFPSEPHYQPRAFGLNGHGKWHEQHDGNGYSTMPPAIDEQFAAMNLGGDRSRRGNLPPPAATAQHAFQPTAPDFFPGALASPTTAGAVAPGLNGEANWSWNGFSA